MEHAASNFDLMSYYGYHSGKRQTIIRGKLHLVRLFFKMFVYSLVTGQRQDNTIKYDESR